MSVEYVIRKRAMSAKPHNPRYESLEVARQHLDFLNSGKVAMRHYEELGVKMYYIVKITKELVEG